MRFHQGDEQRMSTTTKKDLIDRIAEETGQKRTSVKIIVQSFLENVIRELGEGNRLEFRDFGVFEIRERAPRIAQNPKTLERVPVPAKKTVKFKSGKLMKIALEEGLEELAAAGQSSADDEDEAGFDGVRGSDDQAR
jgi:integration host factor subunit beta